MYTEERKNILLAPYASIVTNFYVHFGIIDSIQTYTETHTQNVVLAHVVLWLCYHASN